jgi:hypothetical protein
MSYCFINIWLLCIGMKQQLMDILNDEYAYLEYNLPSDSVCGEMVFTEYCHQDIDLVVGRERELKELIKYVFAASHKSVSQR